MACSFSNVISKTPPPLVCPLSKICSWVVVIAPPNPKIASSKNPMIFSCFYTLSRAEGYGRRFPLHACRIVSALDSNRSAITSKTYISGSKCFTVHLADI